MSRITPAMNNIATVIRDGEILDTHVNGARAIALADRFGECAVIASSHPFTAEIVPAGKADYDERRMSKKKNKKTKECRIGVASGEHDFTIKLERALKFLKDGHPVSFTVVARGRNSAQRIPAVIDRIIGELSSEGRPTTRHGGTVLFNPTTKGSPQNG